MCELFGFSSSKEEELNDYLKTFYSHCEEHPHGWGLAILDSDKYQIRKEPVKARSSVMLGNILLNPIVCKSMLAHIRLATIGRLDFYNCHPFVKKDNSGRRWTLIHNGTIFDSQELCKYSTIEEGETDSERILLYVVDMINSFEEAKGESLNLKERFDIVSGLISRMSYTNKLNLILSDGEQMYVHNNLKGSLNYLKRDHSVFFSTQALDDGEWKEVPINVTLSFINGDFLFKSDNHFNEYVETEEQIKFIEKFLESLKTDSEEEYAW
ncbi:MAG: class II glutamine amidotransferase [Methanobrevibacter sp.]|jgi:glutamine amidotransferase|nr:class II glutamine amidotransferase [Methanobrevibacter sp.]